MLHKYGKTIQTKNVNSIKYVNGVNIFLQFENVNSIKCVNGVNIVL